ncbi:hypothetical protein [Micromonospora sp. URMC 103]|uniref:hypothetical protein n=1 Tax=Micromonospora sp. URMC 103 TaxID=3423406 RepID=UPI003F1AFA5D
MKPSQVVRARWCDIADMVDLITHSLAGSVIGAWLVPDDRRRRILEQVTRIWTEQALLFGEAYVLADRSAVAVWLHRYGPVPALPEYGERLATVCGDLVNRFLLLDGVLSAHRPTAPHNHLTFFTVSSRRPRTGGAAALLAVSNARMGQTSLPTYTEATTTADRDLYARHGYLPREPFVLPDGSTAYPMWRDPGRRTSTARNRGSRSAAGGDSTPGAEMARWPPRSRAGRDDHP